MRLRELKTIVDEAIEKHGDMLVKVYAEDYMDEFDTKASGCGVIRNEEKVFCINID